jgi:hypothetical protein
MRYISLFNEVESRQWYLEQIEGYKTTSAMKSLLTRFRKDSEEYHDDLVKAYNRPSGMLYGKVVTKRQIAQQVSEIRVIREIYASL